MSSHHLYLTGINHSINLTCERTCGSCYTESWLVLMYSTELGRMQSIDLNDARVSHFKAVHGEFSTRLHHASNSNCSNDAMVQFSLQLTLDNDSIHSTEGNIIISCSAAVGENAKVYGPLSMVVYLPITPPATNPTTGTNTSPPGPTTATSNATTPMQCPGMYS